MSSLAIIHRAAGLRKIMLFFHFFSAWMLLFVAAVNGTPEGRSSSHTELFQQVLRAPTAAEWQALNRFDGTLTREDFQKRLKAIFDPAQGLSPYLRFHGESVSIYHNLAQTGDPVVTLHFAHFQTPLRPRPVTFRGPDFFRRRPPAQSTAALAGLRIAIEPADIGGRWADMEDRSVMYAGYGRIKEGDLNLIVGRLLRDQLSRLGAEVFLVRNQAEPVLAPPPDQLLGEAEQFLRQEPALRSELVKNRGAAVPAKSDQQLRYAAGLLLTKTLETRARADLVRRSFVPDLTIVLQHNATNDSGDGHVAQQNRNIFFVHGAYLPAELDDPQKRLRLLTKLLENATPIEISVADAIAGEFKNRTGFAPVLYGNSATTRLVSDHDPYVVARNLGFNREHDGPVVVTEPYFMNQTDTLRRLLTGDYEGLRLISGKPQKSIFREYADCVTQGLLRAYRN